MVSVCMSIQQQDGQICQRLCDFSRIVHSSSGIDQKGALLAGEKEKPHTAVLNTPGVMVNLNDLILHMLFSPRLVFC